MILQAACKIAKPNRTNDCPLPVVELASLFILRKQFHLQKHEEPEKCENIKDEVTLTDTSKVSAEERHRGEEHDGRLSANLIHPEGARVKSKYIWWLIRQQRQREGRKLEKNLSRKCAEASRPANISNMSFYFQWNNGPLKP